MKTLNFAQLSEDWWEYKTAKVGGRRFGQVVSNRKNKLKYELLDEKIKGYIERDDYESEDMIFGREQEPEARKEIIKQTGINFIEVGVIVSDFNPLIHMHSPDGLNDEYGIVLEIKSTSDGSIHIQRFFDGPESSHIGQIINPFVCSDDVKEVWWYSWNPFCEVRKLIKHVYTRDTVLEIIKVDKEESYTDKKGEVKTKTVKVEKPYTINDAVIEGRNAMDKLEKDLIELEHKFIF